MHIVLKCVLIVLISNQIPNYQEMYIIVLMYKIFFPKVLYITIQMLQNVFVKVFLKRLSTLEINNNMILNYVNICNIATFELAVINPH